MKINVAGNERSLLMLGRGDCVDALDGAVDGAAHIGAARLPWANSSMVSASSALCTRRKDVDRSTRLSLLPHDQVSEAVLGPCCPRTAATVD